MAMIDLHVHTNCSDGELDVFSVLKRAEEQGIRYLAITDHDSIMAHKQIEGIDIKQYYSGQLIKGVELTMFYNGTVMEVLGYGVDINKISEFKYVKYVLNTGYIQIQSERLKYLKKVCDKLGIKYNKDLRLTVSNGESSDALLDDIIVYHENKEILDKMGIVDRTTFYRMHICKSSSPFYIDLSKVLPNIKEVCQAIKDANGKCFLAHIFNYDLPDPKKTLQEIIDMNILDGLECYHKKHSMEQAEYLEGVCKKNNLLMSGGSDFHREKDMMGYCNRYQDEVPDRIVEEWV